MIETAVGVCVVASCVAYCVWAMVICRDRREVLKAEHLRDLEREVQVPLVDLVDQAEQKASSPQPLFRPRDY